MATSKTKAEEDAATEKSVNDTFAKSSGQTSGALEPNAEANVAPQGPVEGAVIVPQGTPAPQVGGVYPSNLGEFGLVKGQLPEGHEAVPNPVIEAEKAAEQRETEAADEEPLSQEEQEAQGRVVIPEPTTYKGA